MLTQSIKAYSHAKSLIKSYQRASKAESFCDWDRWSTAYLRLLQIYIYIFDFSGEQPSTKRLQGSRFPSLFTNNFMIYTHKRNACVGGGGGVEEEEFRCDTTHSQKPIWAPASPW